MSDPITYDDVVSPTTAVSHPATADNHPATAVVVIATAVIYPATAVVVLVSRRGHGAVKATHEDKKTVRRLHNT